jgi:hypothetical protein
MLERYCSLVAEVGDIGYRNRASARFSEEPGTDHVFSSVGAALSATAAGTVRDQANPYASFRFSCSSWRVYAASAPSIFVQAQGTLS